MVEESYEQEGRLISSTAAATDESMFASAAAAATDESLFISSITTNTDERLFVSVPIKRHDLSTPWWVSERHPFRRHFTTKYLSLMKSLFRSTKSLLAVVL